MSAEHFARQQNTHSSAGHLEASPGPALRQATGDEVGTISKCPVALGRRAVSRPASPCFPRPLPVLPAFRCHGPYTVSLAQAPDVRRSTFLRVSQSQTRKEDLLFLQTLPYSSVFHDDVPSIKRISPGPLARTVLYSHARPGCVGCTVQVRANVCTMTASPTEHASPSSSSTFVFNIGMTGF